MGRTITDEMATLMMDMATFTYVKDSVIVETNKGKLCEVLQD